MASLLLIILASVITPVGADGNGDSVVAEDSNSYTVRAPIRIDGNSDFASQAAQEGWPGDGSPGNPYIIEGYEIDVSGHGHGIYVGNTTVHFFVRRCYIHNISGIPPYPAHETNQAGIFLLRTQNGRLYGNNIHRGFSGITLDYSDNNIIDNNSFSVSYKRGLFLLQSNNNIISNNTLFGPGRDHRYPVDGIYLFLSEDNLISDNYLSGFPLAICVEYESGTPDTNVFQNNTFNNTRIEIQYVEMVNGTPVPSVNFALATVAILTAVCLTWKKKRGYKGEDPN